MAAEKSDEANAAQAPATPSAAEAAGHAERKSVIRSAGVMSVMTVLSRILGLLRDRLMAGIFGASAVNDAFNLAFLLPNLTRRLFGEGALSSVFVPVFSGRLALGKREDAFRTASVVLTRLAAGLFVACVLFAAAALGARFFAPLEPHRLLTLELASWMVFYCVLINVAAVLMGILNALEHFAMPAFAPVLLNLCMIAALTVGLDLLGPAEESRITVVGLSVIAGGVLQLVVLVPPALAHGFKFSPSLDAGDEGYQEVRAGFLPVVLGVALFQVNLLLDQVIAATLIPEEGPVTILAYGNRLIQLPWAIFSLALATAALPLLSRYWAQEKKDDFGKTVASAARSTLYLAAPSAVGLCILSTDLARLFYGTGAFLANNAEAVHRTGDVIFYFSLGLCFYSLNALLSRALYAAKDTRTPTVAAGIAVAVNLALNLALVLGTGMKESGLALASAISGAVQTAFLLRALFKKLGPPDMARLSGFAGSLALGGALAMLGAVLAYRRFGANQDADFLAFIFAAAASVICLGLIPDFYFAQQFKAPTALERFARMLGGKVDAAAGARYGTPEEKWPLDLLVYHGLFTTALSCTAMGLMVWSVRDSLPPDSNTGGLVFQRGVVPVCVGVGIYVMASGMFRSREYEELKAALGRRRTASAKSEVRSEKE